MEDSLDPKADLDEVWADFVHDYYSITRQNLLLDSTVDELKSGLDVSFGSGVSKRAGRAKVVTARLGECLQCLGDVMASTAGIVFGPSAQCWNAVSFIISAVRKYQGLFDGFITLMERTTAFLDRLATFLKSNHGGSYLAPDLRGATYQILGHFLKVLANAYKVALSRKEKLKMYAGVILFAEEDVVQADLDRMERMVQHLLHVEVDEILRDVKGLARFLRYSHEERQQHDIEIREFLQQVDVKLDVKLHDISNSITHVRVMQDEQACQQEYQSCLKTIKDALLLGQQDSQQRQHHKLRSSRLKGTGQWLMSNDWFQRWVSAEELGVNLLALLGDEGYGKSYMCSHVVDHLLKMRSEGRRLVVAYHYFSPEPSKTSNLADCLGSLVYQMAEGDERYARAVAKACSARSCDGRPETIWSSLIVDLEDTMDGPYYLVISNPSRATDAATDAAIGANTFVDLSRRLSPLGQNMLRMFIATTDVYPMKAMPHELACITLGHSIREAEFQRSLQRVNEHTSRIERRFVVYPFKVQDEHNYEDLLILTNTYLQGHFAAADCETLSLGSKDDIISTLIEGTAGDYKLLLSKLGLIKSADTDHAIVECVARAGESRAESLAWTMTDLSNRCAEDEIAIANEILPWVLAGYSSIDVRLLQAAVFMSTGIRYRIRTKITTKLAVLFRLDDEDNIYSVHGADELRKALIYQDERADLRAEQPAICNAEATMVTHLLQKNCDAELYERLGVDEFLRCKLKPQAARILVGTNRALHAHLLQRCAQALCLKNDRPDLELVQTYASKWFVEHLHDTVSDSGEIAEDVKPSMLENLGSKLAVMLWEFHAIDRWVPNDHIFHASPRWLLSDNGVLKLQQLLRHSLVQKGYASNSDCHQWLRSVVMVSSHPNNILSRILLRRASSSMLFQTKYCAYPEREEIMCIVRMETSHSTWS